MRRAAALFLLFFLTIPFHALTQMTKLCIDPLCKDSLFTSVFTRDHRITHEHFLQGNKGDMVKVVSFKFSNRVDIMEAEDEKGNRGMIFANHIDLVPYVFALESALKKNDKLFLMNADPSLQGAGGMKRLLGERWSNPEVLRDYEVNAKSLELEVTSIELNSSTASSSPESKEHAHEHHHHHHHPPSSSSEVADLEKSKENDPLLKKTPVVSDNVPAEANAPASTQKEEESASGETSPPSPLSSLDKDSPTPVGEKSTTIPVPTVVPNEPTTQPLSKSSEEGVGDYIRKKVATLGALGNMLEIAARNSAESSAEKEEGGESGEPPTGTTALPQSEELAGGGVDKKTPEESTLAANQPPLKIPAETLQNPGHVDSLPAVTATTTPSPIAAQTRAETAASDVPPSEVKGGQPPPQPNEVNMIPTSTSTPKQEEMVVKEISAASGVTSTPSPQLGKKTDVLPTATTQAPPMQDVVSEVPITTTTTITTITTTAPSITAPELSTPLPSASDHQPPMGEGATQSIMPPADPPTVSPPVTRQPEKKEMAGDGKEKEAEKDQPDYCHKDECSGHDPKLHHHHNSPSISHYHHNMAAEGEKNQSESTEWHRMLSRLVIDGVLEPARSQLPVPLNQFDHTGLIVLGFLIASMVGHLINTCFRSSGNERDLVDGRLLHDCMTRLREQELLIKKYRQSIEQLQKLAEAGAATEAILNEKEQLEAKFRDAKKMFSELEKECRSLRSTSERQKEALEGKNKEIALLNKQLHDRESEVTALNDKVIAVNERLSTTTSALEKTLREAEQHRQSTDLLKSQLRDKAAETERLESRLSAATDECKLNKQQCEELRAQTDELLQMVSELQLSQQPQGDTTATTSEEQPQQMQDAASGLDENGAGSGGSGWSDLGDPTVDESLGACGDDDGTLKSEKRTPSSPPFSGDEGRRERTLSATTNHTAKAAVPTVQRLSSSTSLLEVAQLKAELKRVEAERDSLRITLSNEERESAALTQRADQLRQDLVDKRRESEQRERERQELQVQCAKLLAMVEERDKKLENNEGERERLRTKVAQCESELRDVEDAKRELSLKVKELERELRRAEEANGKLENRLYHEERRLASRIRFLEEQLAATQAANSSAPLGDLNISGGNSSDHEIAGRTSAPPIGSDVPSLWSDVEGVEMMDEYSTQHNPKPVRRQPGGRQAPAANRNSLFVMMPESTQLPLDRSNGRGNIAPRRRSRSTGRHSAKLSFGASRMPDEYGMEIVRSPLPPRHNRSTNQLLYYSSEGSIEGAVSPPPEMPLLSGVPPPGLQSIQSNRPAVLKPTATRLNVQIHKPANLKQT